MFIANADGSGVEQVSALPVWSPDGTRILVERDLVLYLASADGSGERFVATGAGYPAWSPDGQWFSYLTYGDNTLRIQHVDGPGDVAAAVAEPWSARWSPDSARVLAHRGSDLLVLSADGSAPLTVPGLVSGEWPASWSPDGSRIAFVSDRDGQPEIYVVDLASMEVTRLSL
jgi:Tol biopolymer transport system component